VSLISFPSSRFARYRSLLAFHLPGSWNQPHGFGRCIRSFSLSPRPELMSRKAMIEEFDLDQDGAINEQEFLAIMLDGE